MIIFQKVNDLQAYMLSLNSSSTGFVPTMGALHEGHLKLLAYCQEKSLSSVCSIFVNPSQFNDKEDLINYPRPFDRDVDMLYAAGCDILFAPSVEEIYPPGLKVEVDLDIEHLLLTMEGRFRPGHFEGVVKVVHRLLDIVKPNKLFMGQKDFQQCAVISHLIERVHPEISMCICPTEREEDGLAMSSRNRRLDPHIRKKVKIIYENLQLAKGSLMDRSIAEIENKARESIEKQGLVVEYFEIVDGRSLLPVEHESDSEFLVACTAAWAGKVRLIDNIIVKGYI